MNAFQGHAPRCRAAAPGHRAASARRHVELGPLAPGNNGTLHPCCHTEPPPEIRPRSQSAQLGSRARRDEGSEMRRPAEHIAKALRDIPWQPPPRAGIEALLGPTLQKWGASEADIVELRHAHINFGSTLVLYANMVRVIPREPGRSTQRPPPESDGRGAGKRCPPRRGQPRSRDTRRNTPSASPHHTAQPPAIGSSDWPGASLTRA